MIIVRSKVPLTISGRTVKQSRIALQIVEFAYERDYNRYRIKIHDYEYINEVGQPIEYKMVDEITRYREVAEINNLFNHFAVDIVAGDDFTQKFTDLQNKALLLETQMSPIYGSAPGDWELIDTDLDLIVE